MSAVVRVVIVEDQWMIRDGLTALAQISDDIDVVATGADGNEAIELVRLHEPDVVLMDIQMPNLDGIAATERISSTHPNVRVLVLTTFEHDDLIMRALDAGAIGYLTKDIAAEHLARAIHAAAAGLVQLAPSVAARIIDRRRGPSEVVDPRLRAALAALTPRERDVLRLLGQGWSNREIAERLFISSGTVKNHVSNILRNLELTDRTHAALLASRHHLFD